MRPPISVSMAYVKLILSGVRARGTRVDSFLQSAGIDLDLLDEPSARVTGEQFVGLFQVLVDTLDDDGMAFFSRPLPRGSFALVVRSGLNAPNLERAMVRMARTFRLLQDDVEMVLQREGDLAAWSVRLKSHDDPRPNFLHELVLRIYWLSLSWLIGRKLPVTRFDLAFDRPPYAEHYGKVLPGELRFSQPQSAFWFSANALSAPIRRDETALRAFIADIRWNLVLPHYRDDEIGTRVRLHLQKAMPAWPDCAEVAYAMHMSVSTLQRHLAAEQTTFLSLKDDLRRDVAISRLNTTTTPIGVIATELGFSDSAAFQRAFKSWTGSPPGAYRRRG